MIRAIALDDEPPALRVLSHFCQQVNFIHLQQTFTRTDEAQQYLDEVGTDLLFLDINMPFISGVDFYRRSVDTATKGQATKEGKTPVEPPMVIFTTAYAEYAVEGFTLNAVDYLLKPFTFERFLQAVTKAQDYFNWQRRSNQPQNHASAGGLPSGAASADATDEASIYVRADYTLYKIRLTDILYIEGLDDYLKIHLQPGSKTSDPPGRERPIVARMTMKAMLEKLPGGDSPDSPFIRVHRSFIVPFSRIEAVRNKTILLAGREIPVGASYESNLNSRFRL